MKWAGRLFFLAAGLLGALAPAFAQDKQPPIVSVAPVEGIIDLGLAPFIQRVLDEAAVQIRDALLNPRLPVEVIYILVFIGILLFQYLMKRFGPPPPQEPAQEEHPAPFAEEVDESAWGVSGRPRATRRMAPPSA